MASICRRLASVWNRSWTSTSCRLHKNTHWISNIAPTGVPLLSSSAVCGSRLGVGRSVHSGVCARGAFTDSRFWKWLNDEPDPADFMGDEEIQQRQALLQKVQDMYFAKPPVIPGLDFYKEVFESLIKHKDKVGVKTLWDFMREMNVYPDAELTNMVEPYLEELQRNVWFE